MCPQFDDLLFRLVVVLVSKEETLEDLGDVTHIVDVMRFLRSGQEIGHGLVEDVDRGQSKGILKHLDIITELGEFDREYRIIDLLHLFLARVREVDQVEL